MVQSARFRLGIVELCENIAGTLVKPFTGLCQAEGACGAQEQSGVETRLQVLDPARYSGLAEADITRGFGKAKGKNA